MVLPPLKRSWIPALSLLAGLVMVCPMIWPSVWILSPVGLALMFWLVDESPTWGWAALTGYLSGLGITIIAFYWLNYGVMVYGGLPLPVSLFLFAIYSVAFGMKFPFLAVVLRFAKQRAPAMTFWTWPLAMTANELMPLELFPWYAGTSQTGNLWLLQMADIVGVAGIAYPMAVFGMLVYLSLTARRVSVRGWIFATVLIAAWYGYGIVRLQQIEALEAAAPVLRVEAVQPNTPVHWNQDPLIALRILDECLRLTQQGQGSNLPPDLVVWPEGGTPFSFDTRHHGVDVYFHRVATQAATTLHTQLLFDEDVHDGDSLFNGATLLDRQGNKVDTYKKIHVMPFGEYMPLGNVFPGLRQFGIYDVTPGVEIKTLPLDNGMRVAPEICYEILFPDFSRQFVRQGANVIVNLTDDAWFGPTLGSQVHLEDLLPRAIENRVPLVRCANTGISTIIAASGRFEAPRTPLFTEATLVRDVHVPHISTIYTRYGDVFCGACAVLLGMLLAVARQRPQKLESIR